MRQGEALLHLGDRAGARAQLEEALELAHISPLAQHLLFFVHGVLLQVPEEGAEALTLIEGAEALTLIEGAEALTLIEGAETLFDPRWVCPFCPTGYHLAAATVCARAGQLARGHEFLKRAEHGAARWPGGPWPAAVAQARAELLLAEGNHHAARTLFAAPPRATPRQDSCSTSAARAKRSSGSTERRSASRKV